MEEINNDEIINFLIQKYPSNTFQDNMEKKFKKFERKMDSDSSSNLYYVKSLSSNNNSLCMSKIIMWLLVFLFVIVMALIICKK